MSPSLATVVFAVGMLGLVLLDDARDKKTSLALWLPIAWLAIGGSRNISAWFGASGAVTSPDQYLEGSPLDRAVITMLLLAGLSVLTFRAGRTGQILRRNAPLLLFLLYCAASAFWSDFPFVTFKRWTKLVGNVTMVLVVLTDADAMLATKRFLTRTAFLLIPSSMLFIKYYPELGRYYDRWEGTAFYGGVTGDKNMLGCICMVLGIAMVWRLLELLRDRSADRTRPLIAVGVVVAVNVWLFYLMNSATGLVCFIIGSVVMIMLRVFRCEKPLTLYLLVGTMAAVGVTSYVFQDTFAFVVGSLGRNTTLTGRTDLWTDVLRMDNSPWFGAGFESFFLGSRLEQLWSKYWWHPNEAHNGYLDTYLTLGRVGLALLAFVMLAGFRDVIKNYRQSLSVNSLRLAYLVIAPIYNLTEAPFKVTGPLWILFLFAVIAMPPLGDEIMEPTASAIASAPSRWKGLTAAKASSAHRPLLNDVSGAVGAVSKPRARIPARPLNFVDGSRR